MKKLIYIIFLFFNFISIGLSADIQQIKIVHLNRIIEREPTIYSINPEIVNNGILGSRMGIKDNNTTGKFTNQNFELIEKNIMSGESAKKIFEELIKKFPNSKYSTYKRFPIQKTTNTRYFP